MKIGQLQKYYISLQIDMHILENYVKNKHEPFRLLILKDLINTIIGCAEQINMHIYYCVYCNIQDQISLTGIITQLFNMTTLYYLNLFICKIMLNN